MTDDTILMRLYQELTQVQPFDKTHRLSTLSVSVLKELVTYIEDPTVYRSRDYCVAYYASELISKRDPDPFICITYQNKMDSFYTLWNGRRSNFLFSTPQEVHKSGSTSSVGIQVPLPVAPPSSPI